jgi:hypothetical protein
MIDVILGDVAPIDVGTMFMKQIKIMASLLQP